MFKFIVFLSVVSIGRVLNLVMRNYKNMWDIHMSHDRKIKAGLRTYEDLEFLYLKLMKIGRQFHNEDSTTIRLTMVENTFPTWKLKSLKLEVRGGSQTENEKLMYHC